MADSGAIAVQNMTGSVCNPAQGGCEILSHNRNAVPAANAIICVDLIMGGHRNPVPPYETIDASYSLGKILQRGLRRTALGGVAAAPRAAL